MYDIHNPHLGEINEFIKKNKRLVAKIIHSWMKNAKPNLDFEDLLQEGVIGLVEAYSKYDPEKNTRFSTFAGIYILKYVRKYARENAGSFKPSKYYYEINGKILREDLEDKTPEEIASALGYSVETIKKTIEHMNQYHVNSLNTIIQSSEESEFEMADLIGIQEDYSNLFTEDFLSGLSDKDKKILECLYNGKNQRDIGREFGVSQPHAGRLIKKLRSRAQAYFGSHIA